MQRKEILIARTFLRSAVLEDLKHSLVL